MLSVLVSFCYFRFLVLFYDNVRLFLRVKIIDRLPQIGYVMGRELCIYLILYLGHFYLIF